MYQCEVDEVELQQADEQYRKVMSLNNRKKIHQRPDAGPWWILLFTEDLPAMVSLEGWLSRSHS